MSRSRSMKLAVLAFFIAVISVSLGTSAQAAPAGNVVNRAAEQLRKDPIWVDPAVPSKMHLTGDQVANLRKMINQGKHHDVFVAIVPGQVKNEVGSASNLEPAIEQATGKSGVYAVFAPGPVFRAGGTSDASVTNVTPIADAAWAKHSSGLYATLKDFVSRVEKAPVAGTTTGTTTTTTTQPVAKHHSLNWLWVVLGLIGAGLIGLFAWKRTGLNGRKRTQRARLNRLENSLIDGAQLNNVASLQSQLDTARTGDEVDAVKTEIDKIENPSRRPSYSYDEYNDGDDVTGSYGRDHYGDDRNFGGSFNRNITHGRAASRTGSRRQDRPQPTQGTTIVNNYSTTAGHTAYDGMPWLGYYPGFNYRRDPVFGWGYDSYNGGFVAGVLAEELYGSERNDYDSWAHDNGAPSHDDVITTTETTTETYGEDPESVEEAASESGGGGDFDTTPSSSDDSGGWGSGSDVSDDDSGADSSDSNYSSSYGGGGDFGSGSTDPEPSYEAPSYEAPSYEPADTSGGYDSSGGGDFGGDSGGDSGGW
jgi:hypothetical protein